jgi:hypothetical protein
MRPRTPRTSPALSTTELAGDVGDEGVGLPLDHPPGDARDGDLRSPQVSVLAPVALKRPLGGVKAKAIDLEDELVLWPEEVDLVATDVGIDQRPGEARGADEGQHPFLGL